MNHFEALDILRNQDGKSVGDLEKAYALIFDSIYRYVPYKIKNLELKYEIKEKFESIDNLAYEIGISSKSIYNHLNGVGNMSARAFQRVINKLESVDGRRIMLPIVRTNEEQSQYVDRFSNSLDVICHFSNKKDREELASWIYIKKRG